MTEQTALDIAHAAMEAAPEDDAARLRFFERLIDSELFLLLEKEPDGDNVSPDVYTVEGQPFVLVFDREERLAAFVGKTAPYIGATGRTLVTMLEGQGIGLGVNLDTGTSEMLLPSGAVDWMVSVVANGPDEVEARVEEFIAPAHVPEALVVGLDAKLVTAAGLARYAYLVGVTYDNGTKGTMLAFVDAIPGAEPALARAANEALTFSGIEAGSIDVGFFKPSDPVSALLAKVGLRFDVPEPEAPNTAGPSAPGRDPEKPPILR
jgi:hypothetical protein